MTGRQQNITWLSAIGLLTGALLWWAVCPCEEIVLSGLLISVLASLSLLLLIEVRDMVRDKRTYGRLSGQYVRVEIHEVDHTKVVDSKYKSMTAGYASVNSAVELVYRGDRRYTIEADYFQGHVTADVYLDPTDPNQGTGRYQYTSVKETYAKTDIGTYRLLVDGLDHNRLYIRHKNFLPSGLAEGYEVWQRKRAFFSPSGSPKQ